MAKGRKTGSKEFLPGIDPRRNLKGRPRGCSELLSLRRRNSEDVAREIDRIMHMDREEIIKLGNSKDAQIFDIICARIASRSAGKADYSAFDFLLNRSIGKVKDVSEVKISDGLERTPIKDLKNMLKELLEGIEDDEKK